MLSNLFTMKKRWRLRAPNYREARGGRVLLIWGDIPFWTVVDADFDAFFRLLDGERSIPEILRGQPQWRQFQRIIGTQVEALSRVGVLSAGEVREIPPPTPSTKIENVALNLTLRCNLRCEFCYNLPALNTQAREISCDEVANFLRTLRPLLGKRPTLTILGGEPFLRVDDLLRIAEQANKWNFTTIVSTNGTRISAKFARRAREIGTIFSPKRAHHA